MSAVPGFTHLLVGLAQAESVMMARPRTAMRLMSLPPLRAVPYVRRLWSGRRYGRRPARGLAVPPAGEVVVQRRVEGARERAVERSLGQPEREATDGEPSEARQHRLEQPCGMYRGRDQQPVAHTQREDDRREAGETLGDDLHGE